MNKSCFRIVSGKEIINGGGLGALWRHDTRECVSFFKNILTPLSAKNCYHIIRPLNEVAEKGAEIIKAKTGRRMQAKTLYARECVMEIPEDWGAERMPDVIKVCEKIGKTPIYRYENVHEEVDGKKKLVSVPILDENGNHVKSPLGIVLFAVMMHKDEGNWCLPDGRSAGLSKGRDGKWYDGKGNLHYPQREHLVWKCHCHVHPWYNMVDPHTGRTIRLAAEELSQIQSLVAQALGMERGKVGSNTRHLHPDQYSELKVIEANIAERQEELESLEKRRDELKANVAKLATNPLARLGAGIQTRLSGNRTQEEFDASVAEIRKDCDDQIAAIKAEADKRVEKAEQAGRDAGSKLYRYERGREKDLREWGNRGYNLGLEDARKTVEAAEAKTAEVQAELDNVRRKVAGPVLVYNSFVATIKNPKIPNKAKNDFVALFCDNISSDEKVFLAKYLKVCGVLWPLRNSDELARYRQQQKNKMTKTTNTIKK